MRCKVLFGADGRTARLVLEPASPEDEGRVKQLGEMLTRAHMINHVGFEYLHADTQFHIQPMPRGD